MLSRIVPILLATWAVHSAAQGLAPPENVVHLASQATVEVAKDWLTVTFSATREGPDAAPLQTQLKQALDAALAEARKVARPGEVELRAGQFSLNPRYLPKGGSNGWVGSTELIVGGRDMQAIAALTGRIGTMTISRVEYSLSREAREKVEGEVIAQAIEGYRAKALQTARLFGFTGYLLREVHVNGDLSQPRRPVAFAQARISGAAAMADMALPTEAGAATVSANVNGSVQLTR